MKKVSSLLVWSLSFFLLWSECKKSEEPSTPAAPPPAITGFSPTSGAAGTNVTIIGTNFSTTAANNAVKFNGTAATVLAATTDKLTLSILPGSSTGKITVQVGSQTATSTDDFTIIQPLTIIEFIRFCRLVGADPR